MRRFPLSRVTSTKDQSTTPHAESKAENHFEQHLSNAKLPIFIQYNDVVQLRVFKRGVVAFSSPDLSPLGRSALQLILVPMVASTFGLIS